MVSLLGESASLSPRRACHGHRRSFNSRDSMPPPDCIITPPTSPTTVSLLAASASLSRSARHGRRRTFSPGDSMRLHDYETTPPTSPSKKASLLAASALLSARSARHGRRRTFSPRDAMPLHDFITTPPTSPSNAQKLTNSSLVSLHVDALQTDAVNTAAHCEDKPVPLPEHTNQVLLGWSGTVFLDACCRKQRVHYSCSQHTLSCQNRKRMPISVMVTWPR